MLRLQYIGDNTTYLVEFKKISGQVVQVTGTLPVKTKGFTLSRIKEDAWRADYTAYRTVYREVPGGVQFSNDGGVYVAPPTPEPTPEPEPYVPTEEELTAMFERNKKDKIALSKAMLESYLADNPITSTAHNDTVGVYAVTSEKQTLMMSQYMTYQIEKAVDTDATLRWNESGKSCEDWTEQEFLVLILEIKGYVYPLVSYQQTIEEQINACTTQEELDAVGIDYASVHKQTGGE